MNTLSENWKKSMEKRKGHPQNQPKIENYICPFCGMTKEIIFKCHATNHERMCKMNPNHRDFKGHKWSEEDKKLISERRKKYLAEHPEEHPWRKNSKFKSVPCEDLKEFLRKKGYKFEEEFKVIENRNFSADICFPNLMIIFEINGNQHYDMKTMELLPYYQERHNIMESFGWQVIEIPYNQSYNEEFRLELCRQLDAKLTSNQYLCKFESCQPYLQKLREINNKKEINNEIRAKLISEGRIKSNGSVDSRVLSKLEWEERKNLILNSGVDLNKFGWLSKVKKETGLSKRKIENVVKHFNLNVFKRKIRQKD